MSDKKTYHNCRYFGVRGRCPDRDHELMKMFIEEIKTPGSGVPIFRDFLNGKRIKELCEKCVKFTPY